MRIAVIADVHGNFAAFEACLAHIETLAVENVVIAGDLVNGAADSRACWELAERLGHVQLRGNHERYLYDLHTPHEDPAWRTERFAPTRWTAAKFEPLELESMRRLPLTYRPPDAPEVLVVHATPRSDYESILAYTPLSALDEAFADINETQLIVRAHNHVPGARPWRGSIVITAGSVGLPLDGTPTAKFVLLERTCSGHWSFEHVAVKYDVEATIARFHETGYLAAGGAMVRLIQREVATGTHQMMPFLRFWREQVPEVIDLEEVVERFFTAF